MNHAYSVTHRITLNQAIKLLASTYSDPIKTEQILLANGSAYAMPYQHHTLQCGFNCPKLLGFLTIIGWPATAYFVKTYTVEYAE